MKNIFSGNKKKWTFLLAAVPLVFWSLSETIPLLVSALNLACYTYASDNSPGKTGILKIFHQGRTDRKIISGIIFPLSRKSDSRFDHKRFQLQLIGLIEVQKSGTYWIGTESDDGSWIWLDGKKIVDNGGLHSRQELMHFVYLKEGIHSIEIKFENLLGEAYLDVFWIPPNSSRRPLNFRPHPLGRMIPRLYRLSILFFKISQYWTFFLVPILIYRLLFLTVRHKENNISQG